MTTHRYSDLEDFSTFVSEQPYLKWNSRSSPQSSYDRKTFTCLNYVSAFSCNTYSRFVLGDSTNTYVNYMEGMPQKSLWKNAKENIYIAATDSAKFFFFIWCTYNILPVSIKDKCLGIYMFPLYIQVFPLLLWIWFFLQES